MTIAELIKKTQTELREPKLVHEAEVMLTYAIFHDEGQLLSKSDLLSRETATAKPTVVSRVEAWTKKRLEGIPLQHLTGYQCFLDHEYEVGPEVLIPRPETELLVLEVAERIDSAFKDEPKIRGAEIGLGSGIISVELICRIPELEMVATEVSSEAITMASKNIGRILGDRSTSLQIVQTEDASHVLEPLSSEKNSEKFHFIVSNPPYLDPKDEMGDGVKGFDPELALFPSQGDALFFYKKFATEAQELLLPGGEMFLELASERASAVAKLFEDNGWKVQIKEDMAGLDRILVASPLGDSNVS